MKVKDFLPNNSDGECEVVDVRYLEDVNLPNELVYLSFDFKALDPHGNSIGMYGTFFPNETIFVVGEQTA